MSRIGLTVIIAFSLFTMPAIAGPEAPGVDLPPRQGLVGALFSIRLAPSDDHVLVVARVLDMSPAFRKLHAGDVILSINGTPVRDPIEAQKTVRAALPGDELKIRIQSGHYAKVETIVVGRPTEEWNRRIAAAEEEMVQNAKAEGRLAYLPQDLCYSGGGGEFLGLWALAGLRTAAAIESVQPQCREVFHACAPLTVLSQDGEGTKLRAGGRKYSLPGDWREVTFDTAADCRAGMAAGALPTMSPSPSPASNAASQ